MVPILWIPDIDAPTIHTDSVDGPTGVQGVDRVAEQSFIAEGQTGENSTHSENLMSVTGHGRKRIAVHTKDIEHHVLDDDCDPWEYLDSAGVLDEEDVEFLRGQGRSGEYSLGE